MKRLALIAAVIVCVPSAACAADDEDVEPGFNEQTFKGLALRSIEIGRASCRERV